MIVMQIKKFYPLIISALAVFLIRFGLSFLPSFGFDMGSWLGWAKSVSSVGFANFYASSSWTQYTPGFIYYLFAIGRLGFINDLAIKIPVLLSDVFLGVIIWNLVRKTNPKFALPAFFLYTLNPLVIFDGSVWGQIDGILTLFLFLSAFYLIEKKKLLWSVFFWSLAFLIKPQSIAIAPIFILVILLKKFSFKSILISAGLGIATIFLLSWPFFKNPVTGLPQHIIAMADYYHYTSVNAFNIWTWVGMWKSDAAKFLGLSLYGWGSAFIIFFDALALYIFRNKLGKKANYYLLFAILSLSFFVFPTKVHERYLFPFFAFLLTAAGLSKSKNLFGIYAISSAACFLNLYYPYSYYYPAQLRSDFLYKLSESLAKIIGLFFFIAYFALLWWEKLPKINLPKFSRGKPVLVKLPRVSLSKKTQKIILAAILLFAFVTRVFDLGSPPTEYFDEVYHAFTAKVVLHGDPKAWEWWNTPPAGFAYIGETPFLFQLVCIHQTSRVREKSFLHSYYKNSWKLESFSGMQGH